MRLSPRVLLILIFCIGVGWFGFKLGGVSPEVKGEIIEKLDADSIAQSNNIPQGPVQFVLLSFDGSESLSMWEATRSFAREMNTQGKPLNFTYFVSGVYFLDSESHNRYSPPQHRVGQSAIGFSKHDEDIPRRLNQLLLAQNEGHEIGSHLNGHFDGSKWTESDWRSEIEQFKQFVPVEGIVGLRTPLLARNQELYKVLPTVGYKYDASGVGKQGMWPTKNQFGTWEFPLVSITIPGINRSSLSMDYNEFLAQTRGKDILKRGTPQWLAAKNQIVNAYMNYFENNNRKSKAPVVIGHHFSNWNDGVYWEAMKQFAGNVCGRKNVKCATFSELARYLDQSNI